MQLVTKVSITGVAKLTIWDPTFTLIGPKVFGKILVGELVLETGSVIIEILPKKNSKKRVLNYFLSNLWITPSNSSCLHTGKGSFTLKTSQMLLLLPYSKSYLVILIALTWCLNQNCHAALPLAHECSNHCTEATQSDEHIYLWTLWQQQLLSLCQFLSKKAGNPSIRHLPLFLKTALFKMGNDSGASGGRI